MVMTVQNSTYASATFNISHGSTLLRVVLDGMDMGRLPVNGSQLRYTLASGLDAGKEHTLTLYNTIEPAFMHDFSQSGTPDTAAAPTLLSFQTDGIFLPPPGMASIKMMYIGDSITAGYGAAGQAPCNGSLYNNDHSLTFAARLCAYFGAECIGTVAWSGRGLVQNAIPGVQTMPPYMLSTLGATTGAQDWDFNYPSRPDVIVVNLGTNDFLCGHESGCARLPNATLAQEYVDMYLTFLYNLTDVWFSGYPTIFLGSGPITRGYEPLVLSVIAQAQANRTWNASNVHFLNFTGARLDGCNGHPGLQGHMDMFNMSAAAISRVMGWKPGQGLIYDGVHERLDQAVHAAAEQWPAHVEGDRARVWAEGGSLVEGWSRPRSPPAVVDWQSGLDVSPVHAPTDINLTVYADGSGNFTSVQAALDYALALGQTGHVSLSIRGVFYERVVISPDFPSGVSLLGVGRTPLDNMIISNVSGLIQNRGTFNTHTLLVGAAGVTLVNIAVANSAGNYNSAVAGQSVALHIRPTGDRFACFGCMLLGGQDTVYTGSAGYGLRSYFWDTYSNGTTDSWFGGSATVCEACTLDMNSTMTAGRGEPGVGYLIQDSALVSWGTYLLGRPWGQQTSTVFKNCTMGPGLGAVGWSDWEHGCTAAKPGTQGTWCAPLLYAEYNSTGPGANPAGRAWWSKQLTAAEAASWTPSAVLRGWQPVQQAHTSVVQALTRLYPAV